MCAFGGFDLLHPGHIRLLEHARSLGAILAVAIESDAAIRARSESGKAPHRESPGRPITPAAERAEILAALAAVDYVTEFEGPAPLEFLVRLLPDVVVSGNASGPEVLSRHDEAQLERAGCKIIRVPLEPGYSTSRLIDRILELPI